MPKVKQAIAVGVLVGLVTLGQAAEPRCVPPSPGLAVPTGGEVGRRAPDFTLPDLAGNPVSLSSFLGCPVLLDFWASWCKPCQASVPKVEALRQKYAPGGLKVVAVSLDYRKEDALAFIEARGLWGFVHLWAPFAEARAVARLFGIDAIPRTVFIDRQGVIRFIGPPDSLTEDVLGAGL